MIPTFLVFSINHLILMALNPSKIILCLEFIIHSYLHFLCSSLRVVFFFFAYGTIEYK